MAYYIMAELLLWSALPGCTAVAFQSSYSPASHLVSRDTNKNEGKICAPDTSSLFAAVGGAGKRERVGPPGPSKRRRLLGLLGRGPPPTREPTGSARTGGGSPSGSGAGPFRVSTIEELDDYFDDSRGRFRGRGGETNYRALLASLSVKGDTQVVGSPDLPRLVHPVVRLLHERKRRADAVGREDSRRDPRPSAAFRNKRKIRRTVPPDDGFRVALAVEGGGMRGCVTAGMVTAIHYLGLEDAIDVVYGSSAGTVIGAYFITRQLPLFGPELYYDSLTTAGDRFINTKRFLRALGLGLLDPRLMKDVIFRRNHGKPILDLSYLLNTTMQEEKPLDWETFAEMQSVQPLKIVASGLKSEKSFVLDMERGSFNNIEQLARCMQASCLLPGVAGPVMNMKAPEDDGRQLRFDMTPRNNYDGDDYEPLADALLYQPLPYRAAISEGATHVICLRSRPDDVDVTGKCSIFEKLIVRRFLLGKNRLKKAHEHMKKQFHKKIYAEQVLELNEGAKDMDRPYSDISKPHLLPIAAPPGSPEVSKLETDRKAIFEGVRVGFARCYDALVEDPEQRGSGMDVARQVFPDDILNYDPLQYASTNQSAYDAYLQEQSC